MEKYENNQVIFQPIGIKKGEENLKKTVESYVDLDELKSFIKENQYKKLLEIYPEKRAKIWGVQGGKKSPNYTKWNSIKVGAKVLFYSEQKFIKSAKVTFTIWNKEIGKYLWDLNDKEETWEYLYFIKDVKTFDVDAQEIFKLIDSNESHVQGFRVFEDDRSTRILYKYKDIL